MRLEDQPQVHLPRVHLQMIDLQLDPRQLPKDKTINLINVETRWLKYGLTGIIIASGKILSKTAKFSWVFSDKFGVVPERTLIMAYQKTLSRRQALNILFHCRCMYLYW